MLRRGGISPWLPWRRLAIGWLPRLLIAAAALGPGAPASADHHRQVDGAVRVLAGFGILQAAPNADWRLEAPITRGEMMALLVRAAGMERDAQLLRGAAGFSDTAGHWASGYTAAAAKVGLARGDADGTFRPDAPVTHGEVVALILRQLGLGAGGTAWPPGDLETAALAGIALSDLNLTADAIATRGTVFRLAHVAYGSVRAFGGQTLYQRRFDSTPPRLVVAAGPESTGANTITVRGTTEGADSVTVNGAPVAPGSDGAFSAPVDLAPGENRFTVVARDAAGNRAEETLRVLRIAAPVAALTAPATLTVKAGETAALAVVARDAAGAAVPGMPVTGTVTGQATGTYSDGQFTAGTGAGTGILTLKAGDKQARVNLTVTAGELASIKVTFPVRSVAVGQMVKAAAAGQDRYGNAVPLHPTFAIRGEGAVIRLESGELISSRSGLYAVTATAGAVSGTGTIGVWGEVAALAITGPAEVTGNGRASAMFTVTALDVHGSPVGDAEATVAIEATGGTIDRFSRQGFGADAGKLLLRNGTGTFRLTAAAAEWDAEVELTAQDSDGYLPAAKTTIAVVPQTATTLQLLPEGRRLAANDGNETLDVEVRMLDQHGVPMLDGRWAYSWTISGPAVADGESAGDGLLTAGSTETLTLTSRYRKTGAVTLAVAAAGMDAVSTRVEAALAGTATALAVAVKEQDDVITAAADPAGENAHAITFTLIDAYGVPTRAADQDQRLTLTFDDKKLDFADNAAAIYADGSPVPLKEASILAPVIPQGQSSITLRLATTRAGTHGFTATARGSGFDSVDDSMAVAPGEVQYAAFADPPVLPTLLDATDPQGSFTIQLYDEFGNKVAAADKELSLIGFIDTGDGQFTPGEQSQDVLIDLASSGDAAAPIKVATAADGSVTVAVKTPASQSRYGLAIIDDPNDDDVPPGVDPAVATLTLTLARLPHSITIDLRDKDDTKAVGAVTVGEAIRLVATLRDREGNLVSGLARYLKAAVADEEWSTEDDGTPDAADALADEPWAEQSPGVYVLDGPGSGGAGNLVYPQKSGALAVTVRLDGTRISNSRSVRADPAAGAIVVVAEADDITPEGGTLAIVEGEATAITLQLSDRWGNPAPGSKTFFVSFEGDRQAEVRTSPEAADLLPVSAADAGNTSVLDDSDRLAGVAAEVRLRGTRTVYVISGNLATDRTLRINLIDRSGGNPVVVSQWELTLTEQ